MFADDLIIFIYRYYLQSSLKPIMYQIDAGIIVFVSNMLLWLPQEGCFLLVNTRQQIVKNIVNILVNQGLIDQAAVLLTAVKLINDT